MMNSRFEVKYVVPESTAFQILQEIAPFIIYDPYSGSSGYEVRSLYFDTFRLRHAHEVIDGERVRKKVRFRNYAHSDEFGFLEVKRKFHNKIAKSRIRCRWEDALQLSQTRPTDEIRPGFEEVAFEIIKEQLRPTLSVTYDRKAFTDLSGNEFRFTIDRNIRCGTPDSFFRPTSRHDLRVLPVGYCVIEMKFAKGLPRWMTRIISQLGLQPRGYSKYATSIQRHMMGTPLFSGALNG